MLIAGTGGLARDILGTLSVDGKLEDVYLFDNVSKNLPKKQYGRFIIYQSFEELKDHFINVDPHFCVAIANPLLRMRMTEKLISLGGDPANQIAANVYLSDFTTVKPSSILQPGAIVSSDTILEEGCFVNCGTIIGHDVEVGKFVSFGPGVRILGKAKIGKYCYIGTNAVIEPGVTIGDRSVIGMGKIVSKNLPEKTKYI